MLQKWNSLTIQHLFVIGILRVSAKSRFKPRKQKPEVITACTADTGLAVGVVRSCFWCDLVYLERKKDGKNGSCTCCMRLSTTYTMKLSRFVRQVKMSTFELIDLLRSSRIGWMQWSVFLFMNRHQSSERTGNLCLFFSIFLSLR